MEGKFKKHINKNVYLNQATSFEKEEIKVSTDLDPKIKIDVVGEETYLEINVPKEIFEIINTEKLGSVRIVEATYDNPNGDSIVFDSGYFGNVCKENIVVGLLIILK